MYFDQRLCFFHQKVESQDQLFQMMTDKMLEAGIKGQHTIIVEKENTAAVMKSGTLAVFATPAMIALIEAHP